MSQEIPCPTCQTLLPAGSHCPKDGTLVFGAGFLVGDYVLQKKLGEGGMGEIWLGLQPMIGKEVAVKLLSAELSKNEALVTRFQNEARAVNKIRHENIVDIFFFGRLPDGRPYFIMELLEGDTLRGFLHENPLFTLQELSSIFEQILSALQAAHDQGITHRDLKPENIFLVRKRDSFQVKVLDFGIAKLSKETSGEKELTRTGAAFGTVFYMSPEQCRGDKTIDHRADIYSLGVVLYLMLTGKFPCCEPDDTMFAILHKQQTVIPPAPSDVTIERQIPPLLDALVLRMLAKNKEERPATCKDVWKTLKQAIEQMSELNPNATIKTKLPASLLAPPQTFSLVNEIPSSPTDEKTAIVLSPIIRQKILSLEDALTPLLDPDTVQAIKVPAPPNTVAPKAIDYQAPSNPNDYYASPALGNAKPLPAPKTKRLAFVLVALSFLIGLGVIAIVLPQNEASLTPPISPQTTSIPAFVVEPVTNQTKKEPPQSPGRLTIGSTPSTECFVDGVRYGFTPQINLELSPGVHTARLILKNNRFAIDDTFLIEIKSNELLKLNPKFEPAQQEPSKTKSFPGYLTIGSSPSAECFVDGKSVGSTPQTKLSLTPGKHTIRLKLKNTLYSIDEAYSVELKSGELQTLNPKFEPSEIANPF